MIGGGVAAGAEAQLLSHYSSGGFEAAQALEEASPDVIILFQVSKKLGN